MSIYQEIILEHYRNPRNKGKIKKPSALVSVYNPLCGDRIEMETIVKNGKIIELKFSGQGCAISQASASMLTEHAFGKRVSELQKLDSKFMESLVGIHVGPTRLKCLLLSLEALHKLIK